MDVSGISLYNHYIRDKGEEIYEKKTLLGIGRDNAVIGSDIWGLRY